MNYLLNFTTILKMEDTKIHSRLSKLINIGVLRAYCTKYTLCSVECDAYMDYTIKFIIRIINIAS